MNSDEKECPFCAEVIKTKAKKCKHCGSMLEVEEVIKETLQEIVQDKPEEIPNIPSQPIIPVPPNNKDPEEKVVDVIPQKKPTSNTATLIGCMIYFLVFILIIMLFGFMAFNQISNTYLMIFYLDIVAIFGLGISLIVISSNKGTEEPSPIQTTKENSIVKKEKSSTKFIEMKEECSNTGKKTVSYVAYGFIAICVIIIMFYAGQIFLASVHDNAPIPVPPTATPFMANIDPNNLEVWNKEGNNFYSQGKYEEAIKCYDHILEKKPNAAGIWCSKGNTLAFLKKYNEALSCYDKALKTDPKNKENTLKAIKKLKNFEQIDNYFKEAKKVSWSESILIYDKILKSDPNNINAWLSKGFAYHSLSKYEKAIICYKKVLKLDPNHGYANTCLLTAQKLQNKYYSTIYNSNVNESISNSYNNRNNNDIVYVTNSGKHYHSAGCSYLRKSSTPMSKQEAINGGYEPCSRCNP